MNLYFTVAIISIFMLADYYLTILGSTLSKKRYSNVFQSKEYELNPFMAKDIQKSKLFNLRHLLMVIIVTFGLIYFDFMLKGKGFAFISGMIISIYLIITARHLNNIFIFIYLNKNPELLEGKIFVNHRYAIAVSQISVMTYTIIFIVLSIFINSSFLVGGILGSVLLSLIHFIWLYRYKKITEKKVDKNDL